MISEKIENLIVRYLSHSADISDLNALNAWIQIPTNEALFKEYVKTHFAITIAMNDGNQDIIKQKLLKEIRKKKRGDYRHHIFSVMKYAALAILFMGLGFVLKQEFFKRGEGKTIVPRNDVITLQLENGDIEIITEDGSSKVVDSKGRIVGVQKGKQLVYDNDKEASKLTYNTLKIPNGKRFSIVLSDGTNVHLNSGSSITYPVKFIENGPRQVLLLGEAYFEVAHDKKNPFSVNTQELEVQVYGTKFNISNYPEDTGTEVVLVEGSVSLSETNALAEIKKEFFLKPGYKGIFNKADKKISDEKVNTNIYTSWMQGNLIFRNEPFENIIQQLERSYNVVVINNNKKLASETFNATIETDYETIEQVFNYFNRIYKIEYKILENKIIIN